MNTHFKKNILITGASGGIGQAIALRLASPETNLILHYHRNDVRAEEVAAHARKKGSAVLPVRADIGCFDEVENAVLAAQNTFGAIDVLVNSAGLSAYGLVQDISLEEWERLFRVNVQGLFHTCRLVVPGMVSQKWGRIINLSSMWGLVGAANESLYASTKGAVNAFTKSLAKELVYSGITVNAIAPGAVQTKMLDALSAADLRVLLDEIPTGRLIQPGEIADWVAHLLQPSCDNLTGQIISPNGGLVI
ncbi:MAG: SDR family NAD(P)-dependent oxidoreductase [Ndongobacter sp.]|nr:SDR family NAD(P)-dependent oxidoreductase [Ndongobacter sp.]